MTKAILKGNKVLCGRCLNTLMEISKKGEGTKLIIICKARKNGVNCYTENEVEL